ncbi:MAG: ABC transporter ATP-binding protein [Clostridia bacterium]|nr:ABC transporter ATP-binding protein [Clostridia bacterium]
MKKDNVKTTEKKTKNGYLSGKEVRAIAKENAKVVKKLEKYKNRKAEESEFLTEMRDPKNILEIDQLHTYFFTEQGVVKAVNGVSFDVPKNATVGIVGESGCGKSVTSMSVMRLIQGPQGQICSGEIRFAADDDVYGKKVYDIAKMPIREIHRIRGKQIAMIFQEPMTSLNPVFTIGQQLDEVTLIHVPNATKEMAKEKTMEMLDLVGIAMPERVYKAFPHELSGGMRQRVMIAMALAGNPRLIIADEPTTALDVTIQAQILDLLRDLKEKIDGSILLITHDLGIIAEMADYVVVMYAGRIIEKGTVEEIFHNPMHPYTIGLQKSKPTLKSDSDTLFNIPGNVPNPINMPDHCYFKERCSKCIKKCSGDYPEMIQVSPTHFVACHLYGEEENNG